VRKVQCSFALAVLMILALALDEGGDLLLLVAAAGVHEVGHLLAILLQGARVNGLRFTAGGLVIDYSGARLSYLGDMATALAGPLFSIFAAVVAAAFGKFLSSDGFFYFAGLNLLLGLFNLVPVPPLDGGRALGALLTDGLGPVRAESICRAGMRVFSALLLTAGGVLLLRFRNPSLLLTSLMLLMGDGDKNTLQQSPFGLL
jgi:Zn-dependent protease